MSYNLKYTASFKDFHENSWQINIYQNGYRGGKVTELTTGATPLTIDVATNDDDKFAPIVGTTGAAMFDVLQDFELMDLYSQDPSEFKIAITCNGNRFFNGYVTPEDYTEPYTAPGYQITIKFTDRFGELKDIDFDYSAKTVATMYDFIVFILNKIGLQNEPLYIESGIYEERMDITKGRHAFDQLYLPKTAFDTGETDSNGNTTLPKCYDVLQEILLSLNCRIMQTPAGLVIRSVDRATEAVEYSDTFAFRPSVQLHKESGLRFINNDMSIAVKNACKRFTLTQDLSPSENLVINGSFETGWFAFKNPIMISVLGEPVVETEWGLYEGWTWNVDDSLFGKITYSKQITDDVPLYRFNSSTNKWEVSNNVRTNDNVALTQGWKNALQFSGGIRTPNTKAYMRSNYISLFKQDDDNLIIFSFKRMFVNPLYSGTIGSDGTGGYAHATMALRLVAFVKGDWTQARFYDFVAKAWTSTPTWLTFENLANDSDFISEEYEVEPFVEDDFLLFVDLFPTVIGDYYAGNLKFYCVWDDIKIQLLTSSGVNYPSTYKLEVDISDDHGGDDMTLKLGDIPDLANAQNVYKTGFTLDEKRKVPTYLWHRHGGITNDMHLTVMASLIKEEKRSPAQAFTFSLDVANPFTLDASRCFTDAWAVGRHYLMKKISYEVANAQMKCEAIELCASPQNNKLLNDRHILSDYSETGYSITLFKSIKTSYSNRVLNYKTTFPFSLTADLLSYDVKYMIGNINDPYFTGTEQMYCALATPQNYTAQIGHLDFYGKPTWDKTGIAIASTGYFNADCSFVAYGSRVVRVVNSSGNQVGRICICDGNGCRYVSNCYLRISDLTTTTDIADVDVRENGMSLYVVTTGIYHLFIASLYYSNDYKGNSDYSGYLVPSAPKLYSNRLYPADAAFSVISMLYEERYDEAESAVFTGNEAQTYNNAYAFTNGLIDDSSGSATTSFFAAAYWLLAAAHVISKYPASDNAVANKLSVANILTELWATRQTTGDYTGLFLTTTETEPYFEPHFILLMALRMLYNATLVQSYSDKYNDLASVVNTKFKQGSTPYEYYADYLAINGIRKPSGVSLALGSIFAYKGGYCTSDSIYNMLSDSQFYGVECDDYTNGITGISVDELISKAAMIDSFSTLMFAISNAFFGYYKKYMKLLTDMGRILNDDNGLGYSLLRSWGKFYEPYSFSSGFNNDVNNIYVTDSYVYVTGPFTAYKGTACRRIARLSKTGVLDTTFSTGNSFNGKVLGIVFHNGNLLCFGAFTSYNGTSVPGIVLLNATGGIVHAFAELSGTLVDTAYYQTDNKLVVHGNFTGCFVRLNTDNTVDSTFTLTSSAYERVNGAIVQEDNKVILFGAFTSLTYKYIQRITQNGAVDSTFNPGRSFNSEVTGCMLDSDNNLLCTGRFRSFNGLNCKGIIVLSSDGTKSNVFDTDNGFYYGTPYNLYEYEGYYLLIGYAMSYNYGANCNVVMLNKDGTVYKTFFDYKGVTINGNTLLTIDADDLRTIYKRETESQAAPTALFNIARRYGKAFFEPFI